MDSEKYDVVVLGGGISGLTAAFTQKKKGLNAVLLEASSRLGGVIHTVSQDGYRMEQGPNSILGNEEIKQLIKEVGLEEKVRKNEAVASTRYLLFRDRLQKLKPGFSLLTSGFLNLGMIWAFLTEIFRGKSQEEDETIASFVRRRLNGDILNRMINPLVTGIYAGDPERLSLRSTFKKLYAMENEYGSLVKATFKRKQKAPKREALSFSNGLNTLVEGLTNYLGDQAQTNVQVLEVKPLKEGFELLVETKDGKQTLFTKTLISTLPTQATSKAFSFIDDELKQEINEVEHAPMLLVYLAYPKDGITKEQDGFGYLIPQQEKQAYLGAIWSSAIFPEVAPKGQSFFTLFVGGVNNKSVISNPEEAITKAKAAFEKHMGITKEASFQSHYLYERAIPQFNVGYFKLMEKMDAVESQYPGLKFSGNWRSGVAIGDCVAHNL